MKRPGRVASVACVVALAVVGVAAALGVVSADDRDGGRERPGGSAGADGGVRITREAEEVLERIRDAGLPVEHSIVHTPRSDPDHLLGEADGYRSKLSFEDGRVDGGLVVDNDPGSVALGGVIEVFDSTAAAKRRAVQLQQDAYGIPTRAERGYVVRGGTLLRLSPYLDERQAEQYRRALGAEAAPTATPRPDIRDT